MTPCTQITADERYALSVLRKQGCTQAEIARALGRHRSTISREMRRKVWRCNGRGYVPSRAQSCTNEGRRRSRRNSQFSPAKWALVESVLREESGVSSPKSSAGLCGSIFSRSAMKRSTGTSGKSRSRAAICRSTSVARTHVFASATAPTTAEGDSPANGTSRPGRRARPTDHASGNERLTRCSAPVTAARPS